MADFKVKKESTLNYQLEFKKIKAEIDKVAQTQKVLATVIRLSVTMFVATLIYLGMIGLNYMVTIPSKTAQMMFYSLLASILAMIIFYVVKPFFQPTNEEDLALMIEKRYPQLLDRFICSVEMNKGEAAKTFSPQLIKALWVDTDKVKRALKLDLRKSLQLTKGKNFIFVAASTILLAFAGSIIFPEFLLKGTENIKPLQDIVRNFMKNSMKDDMLRELEAKKREAEEKNKLIEDTKQLAEKQEKLSEDIKKAQENRQDRDQKKAEELAKKNPELAAKPWMPGRQIKFNTPKTGGISGKVSMSGKPMAGIYVAARNGLSEIAIAGKTDKDGIYVINGLGTDGAYSLWVLNQEWKSNPEGYRGGINIEANRVKDGYDFGLETPPPEDPEKKEHAGGLHAPPEFQKMDFTKKEDKKQQDANAKKQKIILPDQADKPLTKEEQEKLEEQAKPEQKLSKKLEEMAKDMQQQQEQQQNQDQQQAQEKKDMAEKLKELSKKMEEMKKDDKKEQDPKDLEKKLEEAQKKLEEMAKQEQNELQKETNKEMAEQLENMKEDLKENRELKDQQEDIKQEAENLENQEKMDQEAKEKLEESKEKMDEAKDNLEKTETEKALEKALEAEAKLQEALEKLQDEQKDKQDDLEKMKDEQAKLDELEKAEQERKEKGEKTDEEMKQEELAKAEEDLEDAMDKLKKDQMNKEELDKMMAELEKAMEMMEKADQEKMKKELEDIKKEEEKAEKDKKDMTPEELKKFEYKRWSYLGKKLEGIKKLIGQIKSRVELAKAGEFGTADEQIVEIKKEKVPTRYKKLVDKYYQSLSK